MKQACESLGQAQESTVDANIPYLIRLQQISEEISELFGYGDMEEQFTLGPDRTLKSVKAFSAQLYAVEKECPSTIRSSCKFS